MSIPEAQLDTWAKQGSIIQSKTTYETVRNVLQESGAPYNSRSFDIFLQGSYGNDTNIYADSDVDVVMMLDSIFYTDLGNLNEAEKIAYNTARSPASYTFEQFKKEVVQHLTNRFGSGVTPGKKAVFIPGSGGRRDCDVLPCVELRRYTRFNSSADQNFHTGICFWTPDGTRIINFPKQHSGNATTKHQNTNQWFKPVVRILKNMRNSMIDKGYIKAGVAPSYFLEGMLYNVPNAKFGTSYNSTVADALNWIINCDRTKLVCANELYYLCHPTSPVTWRAEQLQTYLDAARKFWQEW
ncbi:nucleotidyltransferase [Gluconacetobacter entanii]|uniref:Nucleotidyltransferase n=1 Tax=Gluconacetobacter entanii TaxID=108528 RepID=A0ABT3K221_9PROT|nr:nucleotidyltransferase [Gluconacetobacter entanii]MCW4589442.1 nucleotidyltransferase [Gluconacetobacter entanii]MCW4593139.1 nucleotidyltransferase [Gluconacetobacter entanii]NPC88139.1 nucleotidyltransferase [Gluconacetobacter entanii]